MEEKVFTINLRKETLKTPRYQKSNRAINIIKNYLKRHMKTDNVTIGTSLNEKIWERGDQQIPAKIKIKAIKTDEGKVKAELWGQVFEEEIKPEPEKTEEKKEAKTEKKDKEKPKSKSSNK